MGSGFGWYKPRRSQAYTVKGRRGYKVEGKHVKGEMIPWVIGRSAGGELNTPINVWFGIGSGLDLI